MRKLGKKFKNNNLVIGALVLAIVIMSVGYAALAANLKISGTAKITSTWNVAITSVTEKAKTGTVETTTPTNDGTTASFGVNLKSPGDSATYDVVITNNGTLDAVLSSITTTPDAATSATTGIKYTVSGVTDGDALLKGNTHTVTVKVEWVETDTTVPDVVEQAITITLNYSQKTS